MRSLKKKDDIVVTIGHDDFTKAAGYGTINAKAYHITISGPDKERKILTLTSQVTYKTFSSEGKRG